LRKYSKKEVKIGLKLAKLALKRAKNGLKSAKSDKKYFSRGEFKEKHMNLMDIYAILVFRA